MPGHRMILITAFLLSFSSAHAQTEPTEQTSAIDVAGITGESPAEATYLMCKNKSAVRTLRIEKKNNGGCRTTYTKDGVEQKVGESWVVERCAKTMGAIRERLEKADWKCRDISQSRVSSSE